MAGNDFFGQVAKTYMVMDMLTPPRQPQVVETGYSQAEMNAFWAKAQRAIKNRDDAIQKLIGHVTQLVGANKQLVKGGGKATADYLAMLEGQQTEAFRVISELRTQIARLEVENEDLKAGRIPA